MVGMTSFDQNSSVSHWETLNSDAQAHEILVVVPTYNEHENISRFLGQLADLALADVCVVDDASPDGTAKVVREYALTETRLHIHLLERPGKRGLGSAYLDAFRCILADASSYQLIIQMDADFSHDPLMLPLLIAQAKAYGAAVGSRYITGGATPDWNHRRFLLSSLGNIYARWVIKLFFPSYSVRDSTSGFVVWRRDVLSRILEQPVMGDGYAFQTAMKLIAFWLGYPPLELPIIFRDRRLGVSKLNHDIIFEAIILPWKLLWKLSKRARP